MYLTDYEIPKFIVMKHLHKMVARVKVNYVINIFYSVLKINFTNIVSCQYFCNFKMHLDC